MFTRNIAGGKVSAARSDKSQETAFGLTTIHSLTGKRTENVVPTPTSDVTSIWPPSVRT